MNTKVIAIQIITSKRYWDQLQIQTMRKRFIISGEKVLIRIISKSKALFKVNSTFRTTERVVIQDW